MTKSVFISPYQHTLEVSLGRVHLSVIPDAAWAHCQGSMGNVSFSCWVDILSKCSCHCGSCCLQSRGPYVPMTITEKNRTNPRIPSSQNITFSKCARFPLSPQIETVENESLSYILGCISQVTSISVGSNKEQQWEEGLDLLSLLSSVWEIPLRLVLAPVLNWVQPGIQVRQAVKTTNLLSFAILNEKRKISESLLTVENSYLLSRFVTHWQQSLY